jgi:hypothetical protein
MNKGQVDYAERKALELFDNWNNVTGVFEIGSGYYGEIKSCIVDAVHCGIQMVIYDKINIQDGEIIRRKS